MVESATQQNDFLAETIGDTVERFLASKKNGIACLKEIYKAASKWPEESVRCGNSCPHKEQRFLFLILLFCHFLKCSQPVILCFHLIFCFF